MDEEQSVTDTAYTSTQSNFEKGETLSEMTARQDEEDILSRELDTVRPPSPGGESVSTVMTTQSTPAWLKAASKALKTPPPKTVEEDDKMSVTVPLQHNEVKLANLPSRLDSVNEAEGDQRDSKEGMEVQEAKESSEVNEVKEVTSKRSAASEMPEMSVAEPSYHKESLTDLIGESHIEIEKEPNTSAYMASLEKRILDLEKKVDKLEKWRIVKEPFVLKTGSHRSQKARAQTRRGRIDDINGIQRSREWPLDVVRSNNEKQFMPSSRSLFMTYFTNFRG